MELSKSIKSTKNNKIYISDDGGKIIENPKIYFEFGKSCLKGPRDVIWLSNNQIAVADYDNDRICVFDQCGYLLYTFGKGKLSGPCGLEYHPEEKTLAVSEFDNHRISIFKDGSFLFCFGSYGVNPGNLKHPRYIHWLVNYQCWLVTDQNNRASYFTYTGDFLGVFGDKKNLNRPSAFAINTKGNKIAICDCHANRICVFDIQGRSLFDFANNNSPTYPIGIAWLDPGYWIVSEWFTHNINIYDENGKLISSLGSFNLLEPSRIRLSKNQNLLAIADAGNNRIVLVQLKE